MLIRTLPALFLMFSLLLPAQVRAQDALRIAAVINDDIISVYDLGARIALTASTSGLPNTPETAQRLAPRILQRLINERLQQQEAERLGVTVEQAELNAGLSRIEQRNNLPPGGIDAFLNQKGISKDTLIEQIQAEILWIKVVNKSIRPFVKISDDEINEVIATIKKNKGNPEYHLYEIFLNVQNRKQENDALDFANRLIQQIKDGAPFQGLARSFSSKPSAQRGGDMGWLSMEQLDNELRRVVAGMKPGDISQPFPSLGGYSILMLKNIRTAGGLSEDTGRVTLEQVFLPLSGQADETELARQTQAARALTSDTTSCDAMREAGNKTGSSLSGSLGQVKLANLPSAIANVVGGLPLFTPSAPIRVEGGVAVLMVCERESGANSLESTRNAIRAQLLNQHLTVKAEKRLRDLRRSAFMDIRL